MPFLKSARFAASALAICFVTGCSGSSEPDMFPISGTVKFEGKPVVAGLVSFEPGESVGLIAPSRYAAIQDGAFDTKQSGIVKGEYHVTVEGRNPDAPARADGEPVRLFKPYKFTVQIPLPGNKLEIEVPKP